MMHVIGSIRVLQFLQFSYLWSAFFLFIILLGFSSTSILGDGMMMTSLRNPD
jgi:hypothetical protein